MRLFSILTAAIVAGCLYLLVFEREAVLAIAGTDALVGSEGTEDRDLDAERISVVAVPSQSQAIDTAVVTRGRTEAHRQVEVRAETQGKIVSQPLRKGAFVDEGDLLCQLDPGTRKATLAEAEARLAEAKARAPESRARVIEAEAALREAEINQNASTNLSRGGFASESRVAQTAAAVESARAGVEAAKAGLESVNASVESAEAAVAAAQTELDRLAIEAPFPGLLESDTAELGAFLQPGSLCATVVELDPIKLVGYVPETAVDRVEVGARAGARLATGAEVEGRVSFLSRSADPQTRTFRVEIEADNPELAIRGGQTAEILIASAGRKAHLLPQSALTLNDSGDLGMRLAAEDDTARFAPVSVIRDTTEGVYLDGLGDNVRVIVLGQEYVGDGAPLDVTMRDDTP